MKKGEKKWIVIAWRSPTYRPHESGHPLKGQTTWEAKAAVWRRYGTKADLQEAKRYLEGEEFLRQGCGRIFLYPLEEAEPLARARKEIMES